MKTDVICGIFATLATFIILGSNPALMVALVCALVIIA